MVHSFPENYSDMRISIVAGGPSEEAKISLDGAGAIQAAMSGKVAHAQIIAPDDLSDLPELLETSMSDVVFVMMHGVGGEDGSLQAMLDQLDIAYTGSGERASHLAWDKLQSKACWRECGLNTPESFMVNSLADVEKAFAVFNGALIVKPRCGGSSLGVVRICDERDVRKAEALLADYGENLMVEALVQGKEYTVPILHGDALPALCIETRDGIYDYAAKYLDAGTRYLCPAGLDERAETELRKLSVDAFESLGCSGWGRVDLMRDADGNFQLLEINTVPGMTERSLVPMSARSVGMDFATLALSILGTARPKHKSRALKT
jgi:D-alanine-D-alanine ligase